jgi:hypothetical protein
MREIVKDRSGKTVGYKVKCGSQTIVQDASGKTLGRHDENTDKTLDRSGRVVYDGDQTSALFD